ncbi:hypothetical protein HN682_08175 [Candidatus Peregrinibacteria bacterium]|jgi:hypothetical protein|nr:hypothetical protein [Candidatus Peregrinibacteria bacterium]
MIIEGSPPSGVKHLILNEYEWEMVESTIGKDGMENDKYIAYYLAEDLPLTK